MNVHRCVEHPLLMAADCGACGGDLALAASVFEGAKTDSEMYEMSKRLARECISLGLLEAEDPWTEVEAWNMPVEAFIQKVDQSRRCGCEYMTDPLMEMCRMGLTKSGWELVMLMYRRRVATYGE